MNTPKHFTLAEMTATGTGLANSPDSWAKCANLLRTALFLDGIRDEFAKALEERFTGHRSPAIRVNSGYRSAAVNKAVGGVKGSAHTKGLAADIEPWVGHAGSSETLAEVLKAHMSEIDQLITYTTDHTETGDIRFFHVGLAEDGKTPRGQLLWK